MTKIYAYPYNTGLKLGSEVDIVLANINSEPVLASQILGENYSAESDYTGGYSEYYGYDEDDEDVSTDIANTNKLKVWKNMVRLSSAQSYCRGYATDNIWHCLKKLIVDLKRKAYVSNRNFIENPDTEEVVVAAGHLRFSVIDTGPYNKGQCGKLFNMTYDSAHESHIRLINNIRLVIGIPSLLLDRSVAAEFRRGEYCPGNKKEFRKTAKFLTYQTPTNFWMLSSILAHLMFGAGRVAYHITINELEDIMFKGFTPEDVEKVLTSSNYEEARRIWNEFMKQFRKETYGYDKSANPFINKQGEILDFLIDKGVHKIGGGIYSNWRMKRRMGNYQGHFRDLPSWEDGACKKVFIEKHEAHSELMEYLSK